MTDDEGKPGAKQTDTQILVEAKARFRRCQEWEGTARDNALKDARFAQGDAYNNWQWPDAILTTRAERPCLTNNKVRQHNLHIVNSARQHKTRIKVRPTGGDATNEAAQILAGIVRNIEYESRAVDAYSTAIYHQVESGIGYVRVATEYESDDSFDQVIRIKRVKDPRTVFLDPDCQEYDKSDARFGFVFMDMPRKEAEATYPKLVDADTGASFDFDEHWNSKDHVRVAEYWRKGEKSDTLLLLADGTSIRESELPPGAKAVLQIERTRPVSMPQVEWFKIVGGKIAERKPWPGKYIPIVPFIGEETVIDGVLDRKGHTRCLIHPQQMYNFWTSAAVEQVALQSKTPYIAPAAAVEGYESYWSTANTVNHAFLPYNHANEANQEIPRPERQDPPTMAQGYLAGLNLAKEDMMLVSGQYQAEMGAPGNEKSGIAIQRRQRESDTATYHFDDNQTKGVTQVARIVIDLIPHIYDVARVAKILGEDGTEDEVHIDPEAQAAHQHVVVPPGGEPQPIDSEQAKALQEAQDGPKHDIRVIFNPSIGSYGVQGDVGPDFGTQREEAFNTISQIVQAQPAIAPFVADLLMKLTDAPYADEMAERLRRMVPPQALGGPSPELQKAQQTIQVVQQHAQEVLKQADAEVATLRAQVVHLTEQGKDKSQQTSIADYKAETDRLATIAQADPAAAQVLIRSMLSELLGMPALPVMQAHQQADAEHMQAIAPPEPEPAVSG